MIWHFQKVIKCICLQMHNFEEKLDGDLSLKVVARQISGAFRSSTI